MHNIFQNGTTFSKSHFYGVPHHNIHHKNGIASPWKGITCYVWVTPWEGDTMDFPPIKREIIITCQKFQERVTIHHMGEGQYVFLYYHTSVQFQVLPTLTTSRVNAVKQPATWSFWYMMAWIMGKGKLLPNFMAVHTSSTRVTALWKRQDLVTSELVTIGVKRISTMTATAAHSACAGKLTRLAS